jgi:hypothetical protein
MLREVTAGIKSQAADDNRRHATTTITRRSEGRGLRLKGHLPDDIIIGYVTGTGNAVRADVDLTNTLPCVGKVLSYLFSMVRRDTTDPYYIQ